MLCRGIALRGIALDVPCLSLPLLFLCAKGRVPRRALSFLSPIFFDIWEVGLFSVSGLYTNVLCDIEMGRDIGMRMTVPKSCDKTWFKALSVPMPCLFSIKKKR